MGEAQILHGASRGGIGEAQIRWCLSRKPGGGAMRWAAEACYKAVIVESDSRMLVSQLNNATSEVFNSLYKNMPSPEGGSLLVPTFPVYDPRLK